MSAETIADIPFYMERIRSGSLQFTVGTWRDLIRRIARAATDEDLNAGQRPGGVSCASIDPAGGARNSAFDLEGQPCAK